MPFTIIRNDLAEVAADAIVNTANPRPLIGAGTDAAIHQKAGPQLLEARRKIGDILPGHCAITPAYGLKAQYVIHAVGPLWQGGTQGERQLLESCFESSLHLAKEQGCISIAFPLISTGTYGFPRKEALSIAVRVFSRFLMDQEMQIYLVVWDQESFLLSRNLFLNVQSYIDDHYIREQVWSYGSRFSPSVRRKQQQGFFRDSKSLSESPEGRESLSLLESVPLPPTSQCSLYGAEGASSSSLEELLKHRDAGFTETLLSLIDKTGKKDSEIYKKANVSKQHFSKIRNNPDYKPTKATALAFAIALELDLPQTRDLIGRAGYALTNSSKFDVIITYFISRQNYDIFEINMTLFEFDQMTLGV